MGVRAWVDRRAPALMETLRRFPLAVALDALAVMALLGAIHNVPGFVDGETRMLPAAGLATGAIFAVAGALFRESRPEAPRLGFFLALVLPVLVAAVMQIQDTAIIVPPLLPLVGVLWTSLAAFTRPGRGADRADQQDRFWWLNYRAILAGLIAAASYVLVFIGLISIERALSYLFGLEVGPLLFEWVFPIIGGFVAPLYWLSTLPRLAAYDPAQLERPDFIARAGGFIAQFIVTPLLLIYGLILLAYAAQILITQSLPQGMLGWMVMAFVIAGAGNWLALHPSFLQGGLVARLFRRWWFWLTLIPLALFAVAVFVRIDAYGLTDERFALVAGGVWAAALAAAFLSGRGDIRLIPGLAAAILAVLAFGPWSLLNLPKLDQAGRFERAIAAAGPDLNWTVETAAEARSAIEYLAFEGGKAHLERLLAAHNRPLALSGDFSPETVYAHLQLPQIGTEGLVTMIAGSRDPAEGVDVSATPLMLGMLRISASQYDAAGYRFRLVGGAIVVARVGPADGNETEVARLDVSDWVARQQDGQVIDPYLDLVIEGRAYRLVVDSYLIEIAHQGEAEVPTLQTVDGVIFTEPYAPAASPGLQ